MPPAPLVVVRTIPVMVLPPPVTIFIGFWFADSVATETGILAFLPPVIANGIGITVVEPVPPELETEMACWVLMTWPWLTVTICGVCPDRADPTEPGFTFTIWVI